MGHPQHCRAVTSFLLRFLSPANGGTEGGVKTIEGRFSKNITFSKYSFVSIILFFKNSDAKVNT